MRPGRATPRLACGLALAWTGSIAAPLVLAADPPRPRAHAREGAPPSIDRPAALRRFFTALGASRSRRVRMTHFGDSHVAADLWTGVVRAGLQEEFGDGGRGYVLPGRPWASHGQMHLATRMEGAWRSEGLRTAATDDGLSGPGGCSVESSEPGALAEVATPGDTGAARGFAHADVFFLRQAGGGCLDVEIDGKPARRLSTRGPWPAPTRASFDLAPGPHRVTLRPLGSGDTRLLGVSMENETGVIVDALGINGAETVRLLRHDPEALQAMLAFMAPDLLVLDYGANELFDKSLTEARYADDLDRVLDRVRAAAPGADCLLSGPPAMVARRGVNLDPAILTRVQRERAAAHGCAYFDTRAAMGGDKALKSWRAHAYYQKDGVHLTGPGYSQLGQLQLEALRTAYDQWRAGEGRGGRRK